MCTFSSFVGCLFIFWRVSCGGSFSPFLILIFALGAKASNCISESFCRSGYIPCRIGKDGGFTRRDRSFHLPMIILAKAGRCVTDTLSKKFMSVWVSVWEQFPVRISKDEASFDSYLSGMCERKTTTLWSAALRISWPHIRVAFSLWSD